MCGWVTLKLHDDRETKPMLARWPVRPDGKVEKKERKRNHMTLTPGLFLPSSNGICKVIPRGSVSLSVSQESTLPVV